MIKSILFFVTFLGLCYEACGAMLKGSAQVSQPSQFKAEKSFIQNNNENSRRQLAEDKKKGFFGKFREWRGEENAKTVLMILLEHTERKEAKKSLEALKRMADRKMWNTEWWMNDFKGMAKSSAKQLAESIKGRLKKGWTPPVSIDKELELKELLSVIDDERKSDKWSKLYDSGYFKSEEYMEEQRLEETATNALKILFAHPQQEEAEKSLKALKRMADRDFWNTGEWVKKLSQMDKKTAEEHYESIKLSREAPLRIPPPPYGDLTLKEMMSAIDEETTDEKLTKLGDSGELTEYLKQLQEAWRLSQAHKNLKV